MQFLKIFEKKMDWKKLTQNKNSLVSFSPGKNEREGMIHVLTKLKKKPIHDELVRKLGEEFLKIYCRYRRALNREQGKNPSYYYTIKEIRYSQSAGVNCILKGVTPKQVIRYWHDHIENFKGVDLDYPPLAFLSSPANIETVACSNYSEDGKQKKKNKKENPKHSFSNIEDLDPRVRKRLNKKFDTTKFNDRYLLTIQSAARAIALDIDLYVPKEIRSMAKYLARTIFKDLGKVK